jgi:hypothetical protein
MTSPGVTMAASTAGGTNPSAVAEMRGKPLRIGEHDERGAHEEGHGAHATRSRARCSWLGVPGREMSSAMPTAMPAIDPGE